jgi:cobyrinic acid a,c-diamide synthase
MVGALEAEAEMTPRLTLGYRTAEAVADTIVTRAGEVVTGHEFHRTHVLPASGAQPAWSWLGAQHGHVDARRFASYLHVHWAGHPQMATRFVQQSALVTA